MAQSLALALTPSEVVTHLHKVFQSEAASEASKHLNDHERLELAVLRFAYGVVDARNLKSESHGRQDTAKLGVRLRILQSKSALQAIDDAVERLIARSRLRQAAHDRRRAVNEIVERSRKAGYELRRFFEESSHLWKQRSQALQQSSLNVTQLDEAERELLTLFGAFFKRAIRIEELHARRGQT